MPASFIMSAHVLRHVLAICSATAIVFAQPNNSTMATFLQKLSSMFGREENGNGASIIAATDTMGRPASSPVDPLEKNRMWWECSNINVANCDLVQLTNFDAAAAQRKLAEKISKNQFSLIDIPDNLTRIRRLLNQDDLDLAKVSELISRSPVLTSEILRTANSATHYRGIQIKHLRTAIQRLGLQTIKGILYMQATKVAAAKNSPFHHIATAIVDHSYAVAKIANYLSPRYFPDPDMAFLAGLLHDIGKLALLKEITDNYATESGDGTYTEESFDDIMQPMHRGTGALLAEHWRLSDEIRVAISNHYEPPVTDESNDVLALIPPLMNFSDTLARIIGKGRCLPPVNIWDLPATRDLGIVNDPETVQYLSAIPDILCDRADN